jgi:hypothetical protein
VCRSLLSNESWKWWAAHKWHAPSPTFPQNRSAPVATQRRLLKFFKPELLTRLKATTMMNYLYAASADNCKTDVDNTLRGQWPQSSDAPTQTRSATERQIAVVGDWAVADDGLQWILQRYRGGRWRNTGSYIRSTKDVIARCLREAGATPEEAIALEDCLPAHHQAWPDRGSVHLNPKTLSGAYSVPQNASCHARHGIERRASHRRTRREV